MPENNERPETNQERPTSSDSPDFEVKPPEVQYVQNGYNPDLERRNNPLYEKRNKEE